MVRGKAPNKNQTESIMEIFNTRTKAMNAAWETFGEDARVNVDFIIQRFGSTRFSFKAL